MLPDDMEATGWGSKFILKKRQNSRVGLSDEIFFCSQRISDFWGKYGTFCKYYPFSKNQYSRKFWTFSKKQCSRKFFNFFENPISQRNFEIIQFGNLAKSRSVFFLIQERNHWIIDR